MIVSIGSIGVDLSFSVPRLPEGSGSFEGSDLTRQPGGRAANVAVAAARLGCAVRLLGCVGHDESAAEALQGPSAHGVDVSQVMRSGSRTSTTVVFVDQAGNKSMTSHPGASLDWPETEPERLLDGVPPRSILVVSPGVSPSVLVPLMRAARRAEMTIVLDPAPPERVTAEMLALTDVLTPNQKEASVLERRESEDPGPHSILVKKEDGGCLLKTFGRASIDISAPEVKPIDKTGAGDAFVATLAAALHNGLSIADAARRAVVASAIAVTRAGTQESYANATELNSWLHQCEQR